MIPLTYAPIPAAKGTKNAQLWERDPYDWYVEPVDCTTALLRVERFTGTVLDPCCGGGNIVGACRAHGLDAYGMDIVRRTGEPWFLGTRDFIRGSALELIGETQNIIFNPPFYGADGAEACIRKALEIAPKVAAFVDIRFLAGGDRARGLYAQHPPNRVWIVTPRASCPPGAYLAAGNKAGNGSSDWVWLVWDQTEPRPAAPALGWLHRDVQKKGTGR